MSYIHQLTEDEVYYICSVIPHKDIIRYFTKNPKEFAKIRPGFRANAISKHDVVNLLFNNRNRRFISLFIDKHIKNWLSQIKDQINRYISEGDNKEEAFLRTLPYSFFFKNVKLYFKLLEEKYSEEYISLLSVAVTSLRDMSKKQELSDNNIKELEIELEKLKADIISKDVELIKCRDELSSTRIAHVESINDQLSVIAELQATNSFELRALLALIFPIIFLNICKIENEQITGVYLVNLIIFIGGYNTEVIFGVLNKLVDMAKKAVNIPDKDAGIGLRSNEHEKNL
ncbi:hypothetical protein RW092_13320 [Paenibacillus sp. 3LSP]|uniref:hypothetical protein n=1 Tax=Paenibacillus sp. 3LSP TaxID=2800795 RepID=UPI0028FDA69C|nr:hypothetical protein [Paenibacillus sp. 3LSP]MDU0331168.1 hypothetical protein [Paenibacillus sp. 3LSP]